MTFNTDLVRVAAPLRSQVEGAIRSAIGAGALLPGDRLVERDLCDRFGISRPLLREALRRLEAERLVEISPNRGARVVLPTLRDAIELCQVRAGLEGLAASLAAFVASDDELAELRAAIEALEGVLERGDVELIRQKKNLFYERLIAACGNEVLEETLRGLHNRIQLFRIASLTESGRARAATAELRDVYEAVARRDAPAARETTEFHLYNAACSLASALARGEGRSLSEDERRRIAAMPGFGQSAKRKLA